MTPDTQRAVSDLLRSADKAIKEGNLDVALKAIAKVFEFDSRNVYARAYQERILSLKEAQLAAKTNAEKQAAEHARNIQAAEAARLKQATAPPPAASEQDAQTEPPAPSAAPAEPSETPAAEPPVHTQHPVPAPESVQIPVTLEIPVPSPQSSLDFVKHTPALLEAYKTLLGEIWVDGIVTEAEQERIQAMRESFAITDEEHASIERDVRFAAYLTAIERAWKKGVTNFDALRRQYVISDQEHLQLEGRVFRLLQSLRSVGTVLLVDDDAEFLDLACRQMSDSGLYCVAVPTCEEALKTLETMTPDIVVCDVNFSKPNMSGFAFYEKFRAIDRFFHIPFLFLSGMVQEAVQRTGMQMGADGYFLKPVDLELFLATIEGKIKRSHEVHQRLSPHRL